MFLVSGIFLQYFLPNMKVLSKYKGFHLKYSLTKPYKLTMVWVIKDMLLIMIKNVFYGCKVETIPVMIASEIISARGKK